MEASDWVCSIGNKTSECKRGKWIHQVLNYFLLINLLYKILGNFLNAVSPIGGGIFSGFFEFVEPIESEMDRNYTFEFYTFINCQNQSCEVAGDFIALGIRKQGDLNYEIIFRRSSSDRKLDNKWVKESVSNYLKNGTNYYVRWEKLALAISYISNAF